MCNFHKINKDIYNKAMSYGDSAATLSMTRILDTSITIAFRSPLRILDTKDSIIMHISSRKLSSYTLYI